MIDALHERPAGTAKRYFSENRKRFVEGKHYYQLKQEAAQNFLTQFASTKSVSPSSINKVRSLMVLTLKGYLHLVKSFTDNLAWQVHDELIDGYFVNKTQPASNALLTGELKQVLGAFGEKVQSLEERIPNC